MHTLLDLQGNIPSFNQITAAKLNDVNILDELLPEPSAIYVMDRAYLDYERLHRFHVMGVPLWCGPNQTPNKSDFTRTQMTGNKG